MKRFWSILLLLLVAVSTTSAEAWAERRVALVIGNGDYRGSRLTNPVSDARDVADRLRQLKFDVDLVVNAKLDDFEVALERFSGSAIGADAVLVFYAGHSFQFEDQNWLMPIDADVESPARARRSNISLQQMLRDVTGRARVTLVFLDACRNNPLAERFHAAQKAAGRAFSTERGLARVDVGTPETLLVYATRPNMVAADGDGRNSPFTTALLEQLRTPEIEIEAMMKRVTAAVEKATAGRQTPERLSALRQEFYFRTPGATAVTDAPKQVPTVTADPEERARADFDRAKAIGTQAAWAAFLQVYDKGLYAALARAEVEKLRGQEEDRACVGEERAIAALITAKDRQGLVKLEPTAKCPASAGRIARALADLDRSAAEERSRSADEAAGRTREATCRREVEKIAALRAQSREGDLSMLKGRVECPEAAAALEIALRDIRGAATGPDANGVQASRAPTAATDTRDTGADLKRIQTALWKLGCHTGATGDLFRDETKVALAKYFRAKHITSEIPNDFAKGSLATWLEQQATLEAHKIEPSCTETCPKGTVMVGGLCIAQQLAGPAVPPTSSSAPKTGETREGAKPVPSRTPAGTSAQPARSSVSKASETKEGTKPTPAQKAATKVTPSTSAGKPETKEGTMASKSSAAGSDCDKLTNARYRAACRCNVSAGGRARMNGSGRVEWFRPPGVHLALDKCLAGL